MDPDVSYNLENEQQFWDELDEIVKTPCENQQGIDSALKAYLGFTAHFAYQYLYTEFDWAKCAFKLLNGSLFRKHRSYVRRRMCGRLRKEQSTPRLQLVATILLYDGRETQKVFEQMQEEGLFARLLELVRVRKEQDPLMWRVCLELLYEMSRIQKIKADDLDAINDEFIKYLLQLVEEDPEDIDNDPYHYPVIRILLVLNEQYMVSAHVTPTGKQIEPTNKVIKILCYYGTDYRTFGENIVLLINRESETCLQLLILKLLYLLFTTTATYEYFYSNDLRVLVDVIIRNLLDLPDEAQSLRQTYLRVLYPLLNQTQLRKAPHYKRDELVNLLEGLSESRSGHFAPIDETTIRLASRCLTVSWLRQSSIADDMKLENPAHRYLGMSLGNQAESSISVMEIATQSERPGVLMPSRTRDNSSLNGRGGVEIAGEA